FAILTPEQHHAVNDHPLAGADSADDRDDITHASAQPDLPEFKPSFALFDVNHVITVTLNDRADRQHGHLPDCLDVTNPPEHLRTKQSARIVEFDQHLD